MKKVILFMVLFTLVLGLVACGPSAEEQALQEKEKAHRIWKEENRLKIEKRVAKQKKRDAEYACNRVIWLEEALLRDREEVERIQQLKVKPFSPKILENAIAILAIDEKEHAQRTKECTEYFAKHPNTATE